MKHLCTIQDVKRVYNYSGIYTDEEILLEIENQSDDIYMELGYPIAATRSVIEKYNCASRPDDYYLEYYLGEGRIHHVERAFVGTVTKREIFETKDFSVANNVGMIKFNTSTVGNQRLDTSEDLMVHYVPNLIARYCAVRVAKEKIEQIDINAGPKSSKQLELITEKLAKTEELLSQRNGIQFSSDNELYDKNYGINMKKVIQDHDSNQYLWREDNITD